MVIKIGSIAPARSPWDKALEQVARDWERISNGAGPGQDLPRRHRRQRAGHDPQDAPGRRSRAASSPTWAWPRSIHSLMVLSIALPLPFPGGVRRTSSTG
ncbi:MAG: hypothetical protein MZU84_06240 [Sphingobacterium sp.]|nr:hypothetical protein [Sphingobacterium sp.]